MQIHIISYLSGISNAIYTVICLLCGLQLGWHILFHRWKSNLPVSRLLGIIFLLMGTAGICYLVAYTDTSLTWLDTIGTVIDLIMLIGLPCIAYILYANQKPSAKTIGLLALPYLVGIGLIWALCDTWQTLLVNLILLILTAHYAWFALQIHRKQSSESERNSMQWIGIFIAILVGCWLLRLVFGNVKCLQEWTYIAVFFYMSAAVLYMFTKAINYGEPLTIPAQQAADNPNDNTNDTPNDNPNDNTNSEYTIHRLQKLMQQDKLYLNADLTIDAVANHLNTTPRYISAVIHKDVHTSFAQFVNTYRVERAKELLRTTNDKVEYIGCVCGFNSTQVFNRTFAKLVGQTPSDYRKG